MLYQFFLHLTFQWHTCIPNQILQECCLQAPVKMKTKQQLKKNPLKHGKVLYQYSQNTSNLLIKFIETISFLKVMCKAIFYLKLSIPYLKRVFFYAVLLFSIKS